MSLGQNFVKISFVKRIIKYLGEVRVELSKVVWPKKQVVVKLTLTVLIITGVVGGYVGSLDFIFTKLLELLVAK